VLTLLLYPKLEGQHLANYTNFAALSNEKTEANSSAEHSLCAATSRRPITPE